MPSQPYFMCVSKPLAACIPKKLLSLIRRGRDRRHHRAGDHALPLITPGLQHTLLSASANHFGQEVQINTEMTVSSLSTAPSNAQGMTLGVRKPGFNPSSFIKPFHLFADLSFPILWVLSPQPRNRHETSAREPCEDKGAGAQIALSLCSLLSTPS